MEKKEIVKKEIMKYKELLDEKIITEEEFSIKKKELLFTIK
ncbi:SHOCT domain-containing protein [Clostridium estertheticum]|nr:SHOCT domain-containing protein [Clostridium estertheticum]MCB2309457.1 SHOCT domain-containing protein [Clostridium estertheticum]MCB2347899.1 SHOCT domain-containing protein [Clostridium estertheticum]MCB2352410.1 SHOCT domain-containing protein [Clostridium estertheticum]WAG48578.1 SHOCT domain-containing protein [Clostridium estertheticum]